MAAPELQSNKSATCLFIILGAFYHSADGCYLGRLSSSLPAARRAELSSTESGPAPARGPRRWPPARVPPPLSPAPLLSAPPPTLKEQGAPPPPPCQSGAGAPGAEPLITLRARCSRCVWGGGEKAARSPAGGGGGCWRRSSRRLKPFTRRLRTMGPREGAAGDSGWKIKPEKIKGEACGKDSDHAASWCACGAGGGGPRS